MIDTKGTLYQDLTKILVTRDQIAEKVRDLGRVLTERYQGDDSKKDVHEADPDYLRRCREAVRYAAGHDPYAKWYMLNCCYGDEMRTPESIHKELVQLIQKIIDGGEQE